MDRGRVPLGDRRRCLGRDVEVQLLQLIVGFRREDNRVRRRHHILAVVFLCTAASRALTRSTLTARAGSAFSAS